MMSFPLVPFDEFTITCFRPKNEVLRSLQDNIAVWSGGYSYFERYWKTYNMRFAGKLTNNYFDIIRRGKETFKPRIEGRIRDGGHTTYIDVTAKPRYITIGVVGLVFLLMITRLVNSAFGDEELSTTVGLAAAIFFGYTVWLLMFFWDVRMVKKELLEIVRGEIHPN